MSVGTRDVTEAFVAVESCLQHGITPPSIARMASSDILPIMRCSCVLKEYLGSAVRRRPLEQEAKRGSANLCRNTVPVEEKVSYLIGMKLSLTF